MSASRLGLPSIRTFTPLGVRFWDAVYDTPVSGGLDVTAGPAAGRGGPVASFVTPSGVHAFRGLPGLRRVEYPTGPVDVRDALPPPSAFVLRIRDRLGRFLPTTVMVPAPRMGLAPMWVDTDGSFPEEVSLDLDLVSGGPPALSFPRIYLFPAPTRRFLSDVAVVRASLVDAASGDPAAHARLDVVAAGVRWAGVAGANGNVVVAFPVPGFAGATPASPPPGTAGVPPETQSWAVAVSVRYAPEAQVRPAGAPEEVPTLSSILAQPPEALWEDTAGPPVAELAAELRFGRELALATAGSEVSALLVGGGSP